jgi:hypothetical protein
VFNNQPCSSAFLGEAKEPSPETDTVPTFFLEGGYAITPNSGNLENNCSSSV